MTIEAGSDFHIRRLERAELPLVRRWAAAEGWNPGQGDAECFYEIDPLGFFVGELGGEPIACISCLTYDDSFGFLGHYIVRPDHRGRGYGLRVWRAGMDHLGDRLVGLDGVVAQQENYRKSGFRNAYNQVRYQGVGGGTAPPDVAPLTVESLDELQAYDREHFPAPRPGFLRSWLGRPGVTALACTRGGRMVGFGMIRPAVECFRVGPLYGEGLDVAESLLAGLFAAVPGLPVVLDAPDEAANPNVPSLARRFELIEVFRTARMYNKAVPALPTDRIYGATSLEAG